MYQEGTRRSTYVGLICNISDSFSKPFETLV